LNAHRSLLALRAEHGVQWQPLIWALVLLVPILLTLGKRVRPGYLDLLLKPKFLVPLLLATVGLLVIRSLLTSADSRSFGALWLPIPDWQRIIFGRHLANPLFYSALIPMLFSVVAISWRSLRPVAAGLALGFAGFLAYAAWAKSPPLAYLPFSFLAMPWLVVNALLCLLISRAMLRGEKT
jgi:serine protease